MHVQTAGQGRAAYLSFKKATVRAVNMAAKMASGLQRNPNAALDKIQNCNIWNNINNHQETGLPKIPISLPRMNAIMMK